MNGSETSGGLGDRGIGWQAAGFALVALGSVAVLEAFAGSDFWLYGAFRTAVVQLYWALVVPLGALFDWGRKMFETGKAIREAKLRQIQDDWWQKGRQEGRQEGRHEGRYEGRQEGIELLKRRLEESGVSVPQDVVERVYDEQKRNGS